MMLSGIFIIFMPIFGVDRAILRHFVNGLTDTYSSLR